MSRNRENLFIKTYNSYAKAYGEKNYEQCLEIFGQINFAKNYTLYTSYVMELLRTASAAVTYIKNPKFVHKAMITTAIKDVFLEISKGCAYEDGWTILNRFAFSLERLVPIVLSPAIPEFNLSDWLKSINNSLFSSLKNARIADDNNHTQRKKIYLQLTQTLLIFVYAEASASTENWSFGESRRFLANCQQYHLFCEGDGIKQYNLSFKLIDKLLVMLSLEDKNGKLAKGIPVFLNELSTLNKSKELRATLTQDNYITLSKIIKACESRFIKTIDSSNASSYFNLFGKISYSSIDMKSNKTYCVNGCDTIGIHCADALTLTVIDMYSKLIENGVNKTETIEQFSTIIRNSFKAIANLKCAKALETQNFTIYKFWQLIKSGNTKEKAESLILPLKDLLQRYESMKNLEQAKPFGITVIARNLFTMANTAENWDESMNTGYSLMVMLIDDTKNSNLLEQIAWMMAKKMKENKIVKTPHDHFSKAQNLIKLPNLDVNKLSYVFLRIGLKYKVMAPELSNKIIHQMLMLASTENLNSLRFSLFVQSLKFDKITSERVDKLIKSLFAKSKEDKSIALQLAAIKYLRFNYETSQFSEANSSLSLTESLAEQKLLLNDNIFRKVTFDLEKEKIETLRYVKKRYINFTKFYLEMSNEEHKTFDDEKEFLLRELKVLANQFIIRGYNDDGIELYMALYKLSKKVNDEFGMIDSCSFFAENLSECKQLLTNEPFNDIIESVKTVALEKCKEFKNLSARKQCQLCFYLLNLVLYYYEDGGDHKQSINVILLFIFNMVGGIGDKTMESAMAATVGIVEGKSTEPAITADTYQNEAIRIKFYSVLFTLPTKYGRPVAFNPSKFIQFVMNHVKKFMSLCLDANVSVSIMIYNLIPQMIMWLEGLYEYNTDYSPLVMTLLKLSLRYGYALKAVTLMVVLVQIDLLSEKLTNCKAKFKALEHMMLTEATSTEDCKKMEDEVFYVDSNNRLCEPIRKNASAKSPIKCLSPKQVTQRSLTTSHIKYLPKHQTGCECGICSNPHNHFQLFCVAVSYARFVYLNEKGDVQVIQSVFTELLDYWENNRKNKSKRFPKNDVYYIVSARMFMYLGHFQWKHEKMYSYAKELLGRGLKGLEKVKYGAQSMKYDLKQQIEKMIADPLMSNEPITREEMYKSSIFISRKKKFNTEPVSEMKKPKATVQSKPRLNLLDLLSESSATVDKTFRIHDDESGASFSTPSIKKCLRPRAKKADETPSRTPKIRHIETEIESQPKSKVKTRQVPSRNLPTPSIAIDLTSPPTILDSNNSSAVDLTTPPEINKNTPPKNTKRSKNVLSAKRL